MGEREEIVKERGRRVGGKGRVAGGVQRQRSQRGRAHEEGHVVEGARFSYATPQRVPFFLNP